MAWQPVADGAAKAAALLAWVQPGDSAGRTQALECLRVVHDVFASFLVAALAAAQERLGRSARRRRYLRTGEFVRLLDRGGLMAVAS